MRRLLGSATCADLRLKIFFYCRSFPFSFCLRLVITVAIPRLMLGLMAGSPAFRKKAMQPIHRSMRQTGPPERRNSAGQLARPEGQVAMNQPGALFEKVSLKL